MGRKREPKIVDGVELWQCSRCKRWLERTEYHHDKNSSSGLTSRCKDCERAKGKKYRQTNSEKNRERMRRYYATPEGKEIHRKHLYRWRKNNPDKLREINRRWADSHREYVREKGREANKKNASARAKYREKTHGTKKHKAHVLLNEAVRKGDITRPSICSECGEHSDRIHGHHKDYSKPLDVEWLCPLCHGKRHRIGNKESINE